MHSSTTYPQQLLTPPADLTKNATPYCQLKKLIGNVVDELGSLGLSPPILQALLEKQFDGDQLATSMQDPPRLLYEFNRNSSHTESRLKLWSNPLGAENRDGFSPRNDVYPPVFNRTDVVNLGPQERITQAPSEPESDAFKLLSLLWASQRSSKLLAINVHVGNELDNRQADK